jgi:hypothetical protein
MIVLAPFSPELRHRFVLRFTKAHAHLARLLVGQHRRDHFDAA